MLISDPNIRVACLSCLGAMVAVQAPLLEVTFILQATRSNTRTSDITHTPLPHAPPTDARSAGAAVADADAAATPHESGYGSGDASAVAGSAALGSGQGQSLTPRKDSYNSPALTSEVATPHLSSGSMTPSVADVIASSQQPGSLSWVIRLCVRNTAPQLLEKKDDSDSSRAQSTESAPARVHVWPETPTHRHVQPLPVRLESLQVLTAMCKGYFQFIR